MLTLYATAHADGLTITGVVVDDHGKPLHGVQVGTSLGQGKGDKTIAVVTYLEHDQMKYGSSVSSKNDGSFRLDLKGQIFFPLQLVSVATNGKEAAVAQLASSAKAQNVRLTLAPLSHVVFKLEGTRAASAMAWMKGARGPLYYGQTTAVGDIGLPAGSYNLELFGDGIAPISKDLVLANQQRLDLGTITLKPSLIAGLFGKPAPVLSIADATGVSKDFKLEEAKGKWVILDFWGYWCVPCVQKSIPELMKFDSENAVYRDKFQIITVHESSKIHSISQLRPFLNELEANEWKRTLPFPIVIDKEGETIKRYGITVFPSTLLIDPNGVLVKDWSLKDLADKLRRVSQHVSTH